MRVGRQCSHAPGCARHRGRGGRERRAACRQSEWRHPTAFRGSEIRRNRSAGSCRRHLLHSGATTSQTERGRIHSSGGVSFERSSMRRSGALSREFATAPKGIELALQRCHVMLSDQVQAGFPGGPVQRFRALHKCGPGRVGDMRLKYQPRLLTAVNSMTIQTTRRLNNSPNAYAARNNDHRQDWT